MNKFLLIVLVSYYLSLSKAQEHSHEFGKINKEELQLAQYAKDTITEAVVIYDIGKSYFIATYDDKFDLYFERAMKIKILSKAGLRHAQISIPYYEEHGIDEGIVEIKGNTYNIENGEIKTIALDTKNTYNEKYNEHWYDRKFAMPDVKEGSVFEVSYKIKSPYLFNLRNWDFQQKIPVIYSEYTVRMIPFYEYISVLQGAKKYDDFKSYVDKNVLHHSFINYNDKVYTFIMKYVPAFKDESFITSSDDYIIKLNFQLAAIHYEDGTNKEIMSTWPKLAEGMLNEEKFGDYLKDSKSKGKKSIDTMQLTLKTKLEKAKRIDQFVKSNFSWNGHYDKFTTQNIKDFLISKTGNCADINLFLAGMLKAAGIDAYPVLLSTRDNGKVSGNYPFLHYFNYIVVFAKIDSLQVLLDATDPLCNFNELPTRCLNDYGYIVQNKKAEWLQFQSNFISNLEYDFNLKTNSNMDSIYKSCRLITTGYEAIDYRKRFSTNYYKLREKLLSNNSSSMDSILPVNLDQIEKPFEIVFNENIPLESVEDKIIVSPFCNKAITENPLKMDERNYPVDMIYKNSKTFKSTIIIPNSYKLLSKPKDIEINNDLVYILLKAQVINNDTITVKGVYEFKKDVYTVSDYNDLKAYFDKIVDKFNEKVVFEKDNK